MRLFLASLILLSSPAFALPERGELPGLLEDSSKAREVTVSFQRAGISVAADSGIERGGELEGTTREVAAPVAAE